MLIYKNLIRRPDLIMAALESLIGPIYPTGEEGEDSVRIENLKLFMDVFSIMAAYALEVASFEGDERASVDKMGALAGKKLEAELKQFFIGYKGLLGRDWAELVPSVHTLSMNKESVAKAKETLAELEEWYEQWHGTHAWEENLNDVLYFAEKAVEYGGPILVK